MSAAGDVRHTEWREVPVAPSASETPEGRGAIAARWVFAVLVATVGPLTRSLFLGDLTQPWRVAAVVAGASVLTGLVGEARWWFRALIAAGAGLVLVGDEGEFVAAWAVLGILLGDWAVRRWSPFPGIPRASSGAVIPAAFLSGLAAWQSRDWSPGLTPLVFVAVAFVITAVGAFSHGGLDSLIGRFGRAVGQAVSWLAFAVVSLPLVVLPWAGYRLVRVDPLDITPGRAPSWITRYPSDAQSRRMWSVEPLVIAPSAWSRWRKARLGIVTVALLVPLIIVVAVESGSGGGEEQFQGFRLVPAGDDPVTDVDPTEIIMGGEEWYETFRNEFGIAMSDLVYRPFGFRRMGDMSSTYVNIEDGARRSWIPPECDCPTLEVWMYGGSTAFGFNQRDEHTIASELTRAAWDDGIRLEVKNRGIPGDTHWREGLRFSWDVTRYEPPDLALFYDGVNDGWATFKLQELGVGDIDEPIDPVLEDLEASIAEIIENQIPELPETVTLPESENAQPRSPEEEGRLVVQRYDSSRKIVTDVAEANGIPVEFTWQPSRVSRPPVEGELQNGGDDGSRQQEAAMEAALPPDVHDLTDVFEGNTDPLFTDDVHHSEEGARIIGVAMFEAIEERLRELVDAKGGATCGC